MSVTPTAEARFWAKVSKDPSGCWLWTGAMFRGERGVLSIGGKQYPASRFSYERFKGKIPDWAKMKRTCAARRCVNPDHWILVRKNIDSLAGHLIGTRKTRKKRCPQGHPTNARGTYTVDGILRCRRCARVDYLEYLRILNAQAMEKRMSHKTKRGIDFEKLIAKGESARGMTAQEPNKTAHVQSRPDLAKVREQ